MKSSHTSIKHNSVMVNAMRYCSSLVITYIVLVFALPASQASLHSYHLTSLEYRILLFILSLPTVLIWYVAFYGVAKLQDYAWSIKQTNEGKDLRQIANGANWIAWGLPVNAILALVLFSLADGHHTWRAIATILTNYGQLLMPLIGFSILAQGTQGLVSHNSRQRASRARSLILILVSLGVVFCYLTFRQFKLSSLNAINNPYHLPIWLMIISLLIPFLYAWFIGLLAAYEINSYGKYIRGVLYRQPLQLMASGLVLVITASIAGQYARSLNTHNGHLVLDYYLLLSNLLLIVIGIGFGLIAYGVHRLNKIEGV